MHPLYDKFCKLCEELAIKKRIDPILAELYAKRDGLEAELNALRAALQKEQTDVEKIEGVTLSSVFYTVIGQKDRKLEKEKSEAAAAEEAFSASQSELSELNGEIKKYEHELRTVRGCDLRYGRLLPQIIDEIKKADTPECKEVIDTFNKLTRIEDKVAKLEEALELSCEALQTAINAQKLITEADNYSQQKSRSNIKYRSELSYRIRLSLSQAKPIVDELCRQIARLDADLVGLSINFELDIADESARANTDEWKIQIDCIIPQIEQIHAKLMPARDRWAKRVSELRIELQERIKAALE